MADECVERDRQTEPHRRSIDFLRALHGLAGELGHPPSVHEVGNFVGQDEAETVTTLSELFIAELATYLDPDGQPTRDLNWITQAYTERPLVVTARGRRLLDGHDLRGPHQ